MLSSTSRKSKYGVFFNDPNDQTYPDKEHKAFHESWSFGADYRGNFSCKGMAKRFAEHRQRTSHSTYTARALTAEEMEHYYGPL